MRSHQRQLGRQALLAQLDQAVVPRLAHQLGQLRSVRHVHRVTRAVRRGRRRAPPVQVVAARTPAAAVVLADRHLEHARVVGPVDPVVRPPDRQLPADVRLGLQRLAALLERQDVQRAARAARRNPAGSGRCTSPGTGGSAGRRPRPSETQPVSVPTSWYCQMSGVSLATCPATRFSSSSSEKWAPSVQHPSSARPAWMPWQPLPKTQFQREVSHVRSQRKTCSSSAGSGNSTHARAKSSPFSSVSGLRRSFIDFGGLFAAFAREEPPAAAAPAADLSAFAFFVFGTCPG